jgi:hypothetical protein
MRKLMGAMYPYGTISSKTSNNSTRKGVYVTERKKRSLRDRKKERKKRKEGRKEERKKERKKQTNKL